MSYVTEKAEVIRMRPAAAFRVSASLTAMELRKNYYFFFFAKAYT